MIYDMDGIPADSAALTGSIDRYRGSAEGAVAGCVAALSIMARDAEEGRLALLKLNPETPESTLRLAERQLAEYPWLPNSYFAGTSPENRYAVPENPAIELTTNLYSDSGGEGRIKFFLACSGADSPRPVTVVRRNDGTWYPGEWSSLIVGIRAPKGS